MYSINISKNLHNGTRCIFCTARKFISKGNKVKVTLRFRGREMSHVAQSKHILDDFAAKLTDIAVVDKPSKMEGRSLVMFLTEKR